MSSPSFSPPIPPLKTWLLALDNRRGNLEKISFHYKCWPEATGKCAGHLCHILSAFKSVLKDSLLLAAAMSV